MPWIMAVRSSSVGVGLSGRRNDCTQRSSVPSGSGWRRVMNGPRSSSSSASKATGSDSARSSMLKPAGCERDSSTRMRLSKTSVSARTVEARHADAVAERVVAEPEARRLGQDRQRRVEEMLVVPLARRKHHAVLAEGDRLPVAVGGHMVDAVDRHFLGAFPAWPPSRDGFLHPSGARTAPEGTSARALSP